MLYYIISFLLSAGISVLFYRLVTRVTAIPMKGKTVIKSRLLYIGIHLLPAFIWVFVFLGGLLLGNILQESLFIWPNVGQDIASDQELISQLIPLMIVSILVVGISFSAIANRFEPSFEKPRKFRQSPSSNVVYSIIVFFCLIAYSFGINNYAYATKGSIVANSFLSTSPSVYSMGDVVGLKTVTKENTDKSGKVSYSYKLSIVLKDNRVITTDLFDDGIPYVISGARIPVEFDTQQARDAFDQHYK